jgi:hypothetical protein
MDHLRHGDKGNALIEQVLKLRIAARNCIADYNQVGCRREIAFAERLQHGNAERLQKSGHRRISGGIRAPHFETAQL